VLGNFRQAGTQRRTQCGRRSRSGVKSEHSKKCSWTRARRADLGQLGSWKKALVPTEQQRSACFGAWALEKQKALMSGLCNDDHERPELKMWNLENQRFVEREPVTTVEPLETMTRLEFYET